MFTKWEVRGKRLILTCLLRDLLLLLGVASRRTADVLLGSPGHRIRTLMAPDVAEVGTGQSWEVFILNVEFTCFAIRIFDHANCSRGIVEKQIELTLLGSSAFVVTF